MLRFLLLITTCILPKVSANLIPDDGSCYETIEVCKPVMINVNAKFDMEIFMVPGEEEIAKVGHCGGIKPVSYHLNFNFSNRTHHNSSAVIKLEVISTTNRIFLNQKADDLAIDYRKMHLRVSCNQLVAQSSSREKCIKIIYVEKNETLILELQNAQLKAGSTFDLVIPSFHPTETRYGDLQHRQVGLRDRSDGQAAIMTTLFQMRYARTAFPCLDQVALKSIFHICIEHPDHLIAASNGMGDKSKTRPAGMGRIRECFEPTPSISTYLIVIALMENYTSEAIEMPGENYALELFAPKDRMEKYRGFLDLSIPAIQYMTKITGFRFPMKRLGLLIAPISPPGEGMEHMGLITLDSGQMPDNRGGIQTMYHELVHLWIGDTVTISEWKEICLQEGLTTYFGLTLGKRLSYLPVPFLDGDEGIDSFFGRDEPLLIDYEGESWAPCYSQAPILFHTITKIMGNDFTVFEKFLKKLVEKKQYGSASIDLWDETMSEVTDGKLKGYIKGWFTIPGPLYLVVSPGEGLGEITIQQYVHKGVHPRLDRIRKEIIPVKDPVATPVLIQAIQTANGTSKITTQSVILNEVIQKIPIGPHVAFLVDPDQLTLSRKFYSAKHYLYLLENLDHLISTGLINRKRMAKVLTDFCFGLSRKMLTTTNGVQGSEAEWKEIHTKVEDVNEKQHLPIKETCNMPIEL